MKKSRGIIFIVILMGVLVIMSNVSRKGHGDKYIEERDMSIEALEREPENTIDVIFVGDSLCNTGISPLELWNQYGITSFSCSQTAQRTYEAYYNLKRAFDLQNPNVVVLETNMLFFNERNVATTINSSLYEMACYYFPIIEYHNDWKNNGIDENCEILENRIQNKGMYMKLDTVPKEPMEYMHPTVETTELAMMERFFFYRILQLCRDNDCKLVMISMPSFRDYDYADHNTLEALADKSGVNYVDFNLLYEEVGFDWGTDVLDETCEHINAYGAEKVSDYLGEYLLECYEFDLNHKNETVVKQWNEAYRKYKEEMVK